MALETISCPSCGTQAPAAARFCPECGRSLVMAFAGRGDRAPDESAYDITPTTAPAPELTPEQAGLEQEAERAGVTGISGGGIPPTEIPAPDVPAEGDVDELPADLREDMTQPASYTPPPPSYSTAPAYATPEYSPPETPRYSTAPTPAPAQYVPYGQYTPPPPTQGQQPQYPQYAAPAETRDISRPEVPRTPAPSA